VNRSARGNSVQKGHSQTGRAQSDVVCRGGKGDGEKKTELRENQQLSKCLGMTSREGKDDAKRRRGNRIAKHPTTTKRGADRWEDTNVHTHNALRKQWVLRWGEGMQGG